MDADRHHDSDNETDGNRPSETSTAFVPGRSIPSLGQEGRVLPVAATLGERDEATITERDEAIASSPWPSSCHGDGRAPKRKRQTVDEALITTPATRGSTFNEPRVARLNAPASTVAEPTAASGAASLNAPGVIVESVATHRGSQSPSSSSLARRLGSVGSQQQQQQLHRANTLFSPHNLGSNVDRESTLLQPRAQQSPREEHGPSGITHRPPAISTHSTSQPRLEPPGLPPFAPFDSTFQPAVQPVAEEKQSSPTFRQSLSPTPNSTSTLAFLYQQQEQQRQQQDQQRLFQQQRQQQLLHQQQRQAQFDEGTIAPLDEGTIAPLGTAVSTSMMAPVTGTIATGDVATAAATSMRTQPSLQPLPLRGHIRNRRMSRAEPSTLSPLETMLWSNRVNSLSFPTSATASLPTSNTLSPSSLSQQNTADTSLPRTTMGRRLQSTTEQHLNPFFRQQSLPSQHVEGSRPFAAMNEERQPFPLSDSTSHLATWPGNVGTMSEAPGSQQPSSSMADSISQRATWPRYHATMNEEQHSTATSGQTHTPASALAFLYQQHRQQEQRQHMRHTTMNQRFAAPFETATDASAAHFGPLVNSTAATTTTTNMRPLSTFEGPMSNNLMAQPSPTNMSPQETLYWSTRPSTTSHQLPESWSPLTLPQLSNTGTGVSLPSLTVQQRHPQIPPQSNDLQAAFPSLPSVDNTPTASWPVSHRALWNETSIAAVAAAATTTDAAPSPPTEAVRAAIDSVMTLPAFLAFPSDSSLMSEHQTYLRCHIQVFCASMDDATTPMRGRIKKIRVGQVGLQCCHCAHLPMTERINGAVYFPATTNGIYQASLNMGAMHLQCGRCPNMPEAMKQHFAKLLGTKNIHSIVGRKYWAKRAIEMFGLVDTEDGIFVGKSTTRYEMINQSTM